MTRPDRHATLKRLLILIALLRYEVWHTEDLATALGCHVRTIRRDLRALRSLGIPLRTERPAGSKRDGLTLTRTWLHDLLTSQGIDVWALAHRRAARSHQRRMYQPTGRPIGRPRKEDKCRKTPMP